MTGARRHRRPSGPFIIAFAVFVYVVMDGFDLGIGILFPLFPDEADRDVIMNSVAPVWDGNETWLVLGGGGMIAAFPLAYAILLPAIYPPMIAMLLGPDLSRRRLRIPLARPRRAAKRLGSRLRRRLAASRRWPRALRSAPSSRASMSRGAHYAGGWWDWLTPFSILTGAALAVGYALLGATWLVHEDRGRAADARLSRCAGCSVSRCSCAIVAVSIADAVPRCPTTARAGSAWPNVILDRAGAAARWPACGLFCRSLRAAARGSPAVPPALGAVRALLCRPRDQHVSLYRAAAHHDLAGGRRRRTASSSCCSARSCMVPLILGYTGWAYWVFRGKVKRGSGYH